MSRGSVWINGSFAGRIDPFDRGLTLGDGVFDTLVAFNRKPFDGDRHLARLMAHAAAIGIAVDSMQVLSGWKAILEAASGGDHLILRTTVTRGAAGRSLWPSARPDPTIIVTATPWNPEVARQPVRLVTAGMRRNQASPLARLKSLNYLENVLAAREAAENGADDALMLNQKDMVACTTIANLFVLSGGRLYTPPVADGAMPGTMRRLVLELAGALGFEHGERSLAMADLLNAEAVFLTNSVRLLSPVRTLDGHPIGSRENASIRSLSAGVLEGILKECGTDLRG